MSVSVQRGFLPKDRTRIAELYWGAFGEKLGLVLGPKERGIGFVSAVLDPEFALCAYSGETVLGVAGFKTSDGAMVGGGAKDILKHYGLLGGLWRLPLVAVLERAEDPDVLCMDGICVAEEARGQGVGSALLTAIKDMALDLGKSKVRLDVIDSNPRARQLYERQGFRADGQMNLGPLRHIFKFNSAQTMYFTH